MKTYTVKVKDHRQNTTHTLSQRAVSQNEANYLILEYLKRVLGHIELEIL